MFPISAFVVVVHFIIITLYAISYKIITVLLVYIFGSFFAEFFWHTFGL